MTSAPSPSPATRPAAGLVARIPDPRAVPHQCRRAVPGTAAHPLDQHRDPHLRVPPEHGPGGLLPRPGHGLLGLPQAVRAARHPAAARRAGRAARGADHPGRARRDQHRCSAGSATSSIWDPAHDRPGAMRSAAPVARAGPHARPDGRCCGTIVRPGRPAARAADDRPPEHDLGVLGQRRRQPGRHLAVRRRCSALYLPPVAWFAVFAAGAVLVRSAPAGGRRPDDVGAAGRASSALAVVAGHRAGLVGGPLVAVPEALAPRPGARTASRRDWEAAPRRAVRVRPSVGADVHRGEQHRLPGDDRPAARNGRRRPGAVPAGPARLLAVRPAGQAPPGPEDGARRRGRVAATTRPGLLRNGAGARRRGRDRPGDHRVRPAVPPGEAVRRPAGARSSTTTPGSYFATSDREVRRDRVRAARLAHHDRDDQRPARPLRLHAREPRPSARTLLDPRRGDGAELRGAEAVRRRPDGTRARTRCSGTSRWCSGCRPTRTAGAG